MIQLNPDCLFFQTANGETIPCSVESLTVECLGEAAQILEPDMIKNAAAAVLHYFKVERGMESVPLGEFTLALEKVLRGLGFEVGYEDVPSTKVGEADLKQLACRSGKGCELFFFPLLKEEVNRNLQGAPGMLQFHGLRPCVKQLVGARRWSVRCQTLSDQIVEFLRSYVHASRSTAPCCLVIR